MARLMFLIAWLRGPGSFTRLALFYVLGMLVLFYCLVGGLPHIPASPAHAVKSPYAAMPKPNPVPANAAAELRKRLNSGPHAAN
jgi:hypothetical protein